jgi:hypothetical protein
MRANFFDMMRLARLISHQHSCDPRVHSYVPGFAHRCLRCGHTPIAHLEVR